MLRTLFLFLILLHGLIHILGWIKAFDLAELPQFTQTISHPMGYLWLLSLLLWLTTIYFIITRGAAWWIPGAIALLLSQALIIVYWQDAKFGTIANILILIGLLWGYGHWSFDRMMKQEVTALLKSAPSSKTEIPIENNLPLPTIVQKWIDRSGALKAEKDQILHFHQSGTLRTTPTGRWLSVEAKQWTTMGKPGFVWKASVGKATLTPFAGADKYIDGKGSMLIKLYALINVVKAQNKDIDQGAALRYLAEIVWYPSAILNLPITWKPITPQKIEATLHCNDRDASGIFTFNDRGQIVRFECLRYYQNTGQQEPWIVEVDPQSYTTLTEQEVPTKAAITWRLPKGDFTWYRIKIEKMEIITPH